MMQGRSAHSSLLRRAASIAVLLPTLAAAALAQAPTDNEWVSAHVGTWFETASRRAPGNWGIAIADEQGHLLWGMRPDEPLIPASTVKLFTTGFARSIVGATARRPTRVVGTGHLNTTTGEWMGTWALELNGDVTFERAEGSGPTLQDLADQLAQEGVRKLTGSLQVRSEDGPADAVYPAGWSTRHRGRLFAPLVGPLTLHENVVWFTIRPGAAVGKRAQLVEESPAGLGSIVSVTRWAPSLRASDAGTGSEKKIQI